MKELSITRYTAALQAVWNDFNSRSRNATFLTDRRFMDYHADRFADHSLIVYDGSRPMALLPANVTTGDDGAATLHSHGGLTYGGLILPPRHVDCGDVCHMLQAIAAYCRDNGITTLDYKPLPHIYSSAPSQEDIYALWQLGATMTECNISASVRLAANPGFNQSARQNLRKALARGIHVYECSDEVGYSRFHAMLCECLDDRHDAAPVHTCAEMLLLAKRFPANISLWLAEGHEGDLLAGSWVFATGRVVHSQYIATTAEGRATKALTPIVAKLIELSSEGHFGAGVEYFDFGTSNEEHGRVLNESLYNQKASMGASGVVYSRYTLII